MNDQGHVSRMGDNEIQFRLVRGDEYRALRQLALDCPPLTPHGEWFYWVFAAHQRQFCPVAVTDDGRLVGMLLAMTTDDPQTLWVQQIAVLEAFRGQNMDDGRTIGESLLRQLAIAAKQANKTDVQLSIAEDNAASLGLLRKWAAHSGAAVEVLPSQDLPDPEIVYNITIP